VPGTPGIIIGRNDRVAWGFTNVVLDAFDVLILRVDPREPEVYRIGERRLACNRLVGARGDGDTRAQPAVDLNHDFDRVLHQRGRVRFGPALVHEERRVPELAPHRLRRMRHEGRQHQDDEVERLLHHRAALRRRILEPRQRVQQLHDRGDGGIERAPPADVITDFRERLVDLGAEAIIRMIYKDGFFHADLHPGNLIVLPGPQAGFIDLGMVGRMHDELRRTLLYYYYALVMGDAENAARYLSAAAEPGRGGDPAGFRRDVAEISTRWRRNSNFDSFSLGQLILESVSRGAEYRMFFPVEMVLMVKALVTFEGVGQMLLPGFDVAEVSKRHVRRVFIQQFSPVRLAQEGLVPDRSLSFISAA